MYIFDYRQALYRRNNYGQPCVWMARPCNFHTIEIFHGIVGKTISYEEIHVNRCPKDECNSRILAKRKSGYKQLHELKDNVDLPVEGQLLDYLNTYLPNDRTTSDGSMLPMLAKVYDNKNNKLFKKIDMYFGQWKINGLRCFVSAYTDNNDMFRPIRLKFQSREGTYWNSLNYLEDYLLSVLDIKLLDKMVYEHYILDGEVYLPGHTVNEINHFVKDSNCPENKLIQYWCYDIAIEDTIQSERRNILIQYQSQHIKSFIDRKSHLNNKEKFIVLPCFDVHKDETSLFLRDKFIEIGFEGLIMRNPCAEYQYGKRNNSMIKYKKSTDGKFTIVDIKPEGIKRSNIPLFVCKNDINDSLFECHVGGTQSYQESILINKNKYIGKQMYVEYGERSGVNQLPFHIKNTYIL